MWILALVFLFFVLLSLAAMRWGYDSRDGINSTEWRKRQEWLQTHLLKQH